MEINIIIQGDSLGVLKTLPDESIDCCITSPPYWGLRDYGVVGQLGLEKTPEEYVAKMVEVFREVKRVLKKEGTLWLNLGDSYAGVGGYSKKPEGKEHSLWNECIFFERPFARGVGGFIKQKDLVGIPWRVAFALQADGWYLRQDIIWHKPNPMPESVTDRCTKSHEYIFLLAKSKKYYFDNEAIREPIKSTTTGESAVRPSLDSRDRDKEHWMLHKEPRTMVTRKYETIKGANRRSVWTVTTKPFKEAHFATFPEDLIVPMVKAGCPKGGLVLDPFMGAGTTAVVAKKLDKNYLGIELNPEYIKIAEQRIKNVPLKMF